MRSYSITDSTGILNLHTGGRAAIHRRRASIAARSGCGKSLCVARSRPSPSSHLKCEIQGDREEYRRGQDSWRVSALTQRPRGMPDPIENPQQDPERDKPSSGGPFPTHWKEQTPEPERCESGIDDNESKLVI